jgi:chromosome segregation ATPase
MDLLGYLLEGKLQETDKRIDFLTQRSNEIMATLDDVKAGIASIETAAANEKAEVQAKLDTLAAQISDLAAQLAAGASPAQLDEVVSQLQDAATAVSNVFTPDAPAGEAVA